MYDFCGKPLADMKVAELRTYLSQPEVSKYAAKWNTKTTKPALLAIAYGAHHAFHASGDADRLREQILRDELKTAGETNPNGAVVTLSEPASRAIAQRQIDSVRVPFTARNGKRKPSKRR